MKILHFIGNAITALWYLFFGFMVIIGLPIIILIQIGSLFSLFTTGYSSSFMGIAAASIYGMLIGLNMSIPLFRRGYYKLPWLYPFCTVLLLDSLFMGIAEEVLYNGYGSIGMNGHRTFTIIAIVVLILGRVVVSLVEWKKPFRIAGGDFYA